MLYSASAEGKQEDPAKDEEEQDEEMERTTRVEADISPQASSRTCLLPAPRAFVTPPMSSVAARFRSARSAVRASSLANTYASTATKASDPHDAARRNLASARHQYVGNIATLTGKAVAELTESDLQSAHGHDVMKRGIILLDANASLRLEKPSNELPLTGARASTRGLRTTVRMP